MESEGGIKSETMVLTHCSHRKFIFKYLNAYTVWALRIWKINLPTRETAELLSARKLKLSIIYFYTSKDRNNNFKYTNKRENEYSENSRVIYYRSCIKFYKILLFLNI